LLCLSPSRLCRLPATIRCRLRFTPPSMDVYLRNFRLRSPWKPSRPLHSLPPASECGNGRRTSRLMRCANKSTPRSLTYLKAVLPKWWQRDLCNTNLPGNLSGGLCCHRRPLHLPVDMHRIKHICIERLLITMAPHAFHHALGTPSRAIVYTPRAAAGRVIGNSEVRVLADLIGRLLERGHHHEFGGGRRERGGCRRRDRPFCMHVRVRLRTLIGYQHPYSTRFSSHASRGITIRMASYKRSIFNEAVNRRTVKHDVDTTKPQRSNYAGMIFTCLALSKLCTTIYRICIQEVLINALLCGAEMRKGSMVIEGGKCQVVFLLESCV
jgi:hypothetical protein